MSNVANKNEKINNYYSDRRSHQGADKSVYEIWEEGGALNDSVTPSTHCKFYQNHMVMKLLSLSGEKNNIFSIGCGNGFIESQLVKNGRKVMAIDCNQEAVAIAKSKGIDAFQQDFANVSKEYLELSHVIYADGVLGHLFDPETQLKDFEEKISGDAIKSGTFLIISNDSPRDSSLSYQRHDSLETFWFISSSYFESRLEKCGYKVLERYNFPYLRPVSGLRNRAICIAQKR